MSMRQRTGPDGRNSMLNFGLRIHIMRIWMHTARIRNETNQKIHPILSLLSNLGLGTSHNPFTGCDACHKDETLTTFTLQAHAQTNICTYIHSDLDLHAESWRAKMHRTTNSFAVRLKTHHPPLPQNIHRRIWQSYAHTQHRNVERQPDTRMQPWWPYWVFVHHATTTRAKHAQLVRGYCIRFQVLMVACRPHSIR